MQNFKDYFDSEMRSLTEIGESFSKSYPEQAGLLNLNSVKDRDPYVERLLEGVAFLTGQIRQRIDDCIPEISGSVLEQLCGSLIRAYPSTSIVEYKLNAYAPKAVSLADQQVLKAVNTGPKKIECHYSTTNSVAIQPLIITSVTNYAGTSSATEIKISFTKSSNASWSEIDFSALELYLHADWPVSYALFQLLSDHSTKGVFQQDSVSGKIMVSFDANHIDAKHNILPNDGREHAAFSILHDYFCARERFLFFSINCDRQRFLNDNDNNIELIVSSNLPLPVDTNLTSDNIHINCTPVVNLVSADAQAIRIDHSRSEFLLKTEINDGDCYQVYSVERLTSRDQVTGQNYEYNPIYAMHYQDKGARSFSSRHSVSVAESPVTYISVSSALPFNPEVLSTEIKLTNGQYPRRYMDVNSIAQTVSAIPKEIQVYNIVRPTKSFQVPSHHDFQWQLISLLTLQLSMIDSSEKLQRLLSLFDWSDQIENKRKIQSIEKVSLEHFQRFNRGILFQGQELCLQLNEKYFSSESDCYLFASVLHAFFTALSDLNQVTQTKVTLIPSYKEWVWKP